MKKYIFLLFLIFSYLNATAYSSTQATFTSNDLTFIELEITDAGTITDLNIQVNLDHGYQQGLRYLTLQLLSPYGNSVELAHGDQNGGGLNWGSQDGGSLYNTVFDDESTTLIYDGTAPFAGAYQPDALLSDFDGQSITGTWQLLITNGHSSSGTVQFIIMVETDSSTPDPYPDYGTHYSSTQATFTSNDLTFIELEITDAGTITDLNIQVNLDHGYQQGLRYLTLQLLSPYGNSVELAHGDQNGGGLNWGSQDGGSLYNTVFDDESTTLIYDGTAPFAGAYQPDALLSDFDGQSITGTWQLLITNGHSSSGTVEFTIMVIKQDPVAEFSATPTNGSFPLTVQFSDKSVAGDGSIASWEWDFGDSGTSDEQNTSHTYTTYGVYSVSLTVTDDNSLSDTETKEGYITVECGGCTWYVSTSGSDLNVGSLDFPFATIQTAIDATTNADTVLVHPGTYIENISFGENNIVLKIFIRSRFNNYRWVE